MHRRRSEWTLLLAALFIFLLPSVIKAQIKFAADAVPGHNAAGVTGYISACEGTASVSPDIESFRVSGDNLTGSVTVTAPANFEVSLDASSGYGNTLSIPQSNGNVNNVPVYVRSAATAPAGKIYGNVVLSSPGAANDNVPVTGFINTIPTVSASPVSQTVASGTFTAPLNFTGTGNTYNWKNDQPSIGLPVKGSGNIPSFPALNSSNNNITATIEVTPQQIGYAYITNQQDGTVSIINTITNKVISTINVGQRPTGTAISPDGEKVYITNQFNNSISVISTLTNKVISNISLKNGAPTGIAVSPDGKSLYVVNLGLNTLSVLDATSGNVISTIAVGGYPVGVVVSPDGSNVFVTNSSNNITDYNTVKGNSTTIAVAKGPYEVAVSPDGTRLYATNSGGNMVTVIDVLRGAILTTIPVGTNPEGLAISPDGSTLYVANESSGNVSVINTGINKVVTTIGVGSQPIGISFTSDGNYAYVTNQGSGSVSVISTAGNSVTTTIPVGGGPVSLGNFIIPGSECPGMPAKFTITVVPTTLAPTITAGTATGTIVACEGSPSVDPYIQQITVSGQNLKGSITATAPPDFEVSVNPAAGYYSSATLTQPSGNINNAIMYVRSTASTPAGNINNTIVFSSDGALSVSVPVSGVIDALPSVDKVANQTVINGNTTTAINFTGTATVFDWTNDTPSIGLPASGEGNILPFTAINNTNSPVQATVTVVPQPAANGLKCEGMPITFTITVQPSSNTVIAQNLAIPNTFTPNGDGINDTWEIKSLENYPNCTVAVYNRWGEKLYSSVGYSIPWDGTYKGIKLPVGAYYYIINLNNGVKAISGWVAIVK